MYNVFPTILWIALILTNSFAWYKVGRGKKDNASED